MKKYLLGMFGVTLACGVLPGVARADGKAQPTHAVKKTAPAANARSFWFNYTSEPKGTRQWTQVDANNWTECYPDGTVTKFHYLSRAKIEGAPGIIVQRVPGPFEVFIPDAGNTVKNGQWLRDRADASQKWSYLAKMQAGKAPVQQPAQQTVQPPAQVVQPPAPQNQQPAQPAADQPTLQETVDWLIGKISVGLKYI
jgi:hypothetical protein